MGQTLRIIAGSDAAWATTLLNEGVPVSFPSNATFVATVSRGGEEASLFSPTVTWINSSLGQVTLAIAATQTASLDPGVYVLQVFVVSGGARTAAFDGSLEVLPTVGSVTPPVAWCSYEDLLLYSDQIKALRASKGVDVTGFMGQRAKETSELSRDLVLRYEPNATFSATRHNTPNPVLGTLDWVEPGTIPPSKAALTAALAGTGLVLETKLREIVARRTIALIFSRQETGGNAQVYRQESIDQRDMADALFRCYQAQVDLDGDGIPDALFGKDVILLPSGTAP